MRPSASSKMWALLLIIYLAVPLSAGGENAVSTGSENPIDSPLASMYVDPIRVNSNGDLEGLKAQNITTGNGTMEDPYLFRELEIFTFGSQDAIYLGNTTDHILIIDCVLVGNFGIDARSTRSEPYWKNGIFLNNTRNIKIINTSAYYFDGAGFLVKGSSSIRLYNCSAIENYAKGIEVEGCTDIKVEGSTLSLNYGGGVDLIDVSGVNVEDSNISENYGWGARIGDSSSQVLFDNNSLVWNEHGILLDVCSRVTIRDSHVNHTGLEGGGIGIRLLNSDSNVVTGNIFENNEFGMEISGCTMNRITGNAIRDNGQIDMLVDRVLTDEEADNTILDNIGSGGLPILYVNSTVHLSDMELAELIICRADGSTFNNIDVGGGYSGNNGIFMWSSSNVNFTGVTSNDNVYGFQLNGGCSNVVIDGCEMSNNNYGVMFNGGSFGAIRSSILKWNWEGIYLTSGGNRVFSNVIEGAEGSGVFMTSQEGATGNIVKGNSISGCTYGIYQMELQFDNHILDNKIFDCYNGILLSGSGGTVVERNQLINLSGAGLHLEAASDDIRCNLVRDSNVGVTLSFESSSQLRFNRFINNTNEGIISNGSSMNRIHHNVFIENNGATDIYSDISIQAVEYSGTNTWSEENQGNYWGDWLSPDVDSDGIVDEPYVLDLKSGYLDRFPLVNMPECPFFPPSSPEDIVSTPDVGRVTIGWKEPYYDGNGVDGYLLFRREEPDVHVPADLIGEVDGNTFTATDDTGTVGKNYYYHVVAHNIAGVSKGSKMVKTASLLPPSDPTVAIGSPANGSYINGDNVTLTWSGEGFGLPVLGYEVMLDGVDWNGVGMETSYLVAGLSDGGHTLQVRMLTALGYHLSDPTTFTVDTEDPSLTLINTSGLSLINTTWAVVEWESTDASSGIATCWVRLDEGPWADIGLHFEYNVTGLSHGEHVVFIRGYDRVGLYDERSLNITVDLVAPSVLGYGPTGEFGWNETIWLNLSFSEEVYDLSVSFEPGMNGQDIFVSGPAPGYLMNLTERKPDTLYNVTVVCRDRAGNKMGAFSWNFTVLPRKEEISENITVHVLITGRVLDENGDPIEGVHVILVGVNFTYTDESGYYNFTVEFGTYEIYLTIDGYMEHKFNITIGNQTRMDLEDVFLLRMAGVEGEVGDDEPESGELPLVPIVVGLVGGGIIGIGIYVMKKRGDRAEWDIEGDEEGEQDLDMEEE